MMVGTANAPLLDAGPRAGAILVLGLALVTGSLSASVASAGSLDRLEPIDDATPGQRSARQLCTGDAGTNCVNATLETSPFRCEGTNASTFRCNVTYWTNLTVTGSSTCGNASVNVSADLAVSACTSGPAPVVNASSGPVTITYDGRNTSRVVNATAWVCLDGSVCERWGHDPVLLPAWREWQPRVDDFPPIEEETSHTICLGDSAALTNSGNPGPGCVDSQIWNYDVCGGRGDSYHCDVYIYLAIDADGTRVCGLTKNDTHGKKALACTLQSNYQFSYVLLNQTRYTDEEIPYDTGRIVTMEVEACAYAFHLGAQRYCETYNHTYHVPSEFCPTDCGIADLKTDAHAVDRPPSVHP